MQCVCNKQSIIIIEFRAWSGAKSGAVAVAVGVAAGQRH